MSREIILFVAHKTINCLFLSLMKYFLTKTVDDLIYHLQSFTFLNKKLHKKMCRISSCE